MVKPSPVYVVKLVVDESWVGADVACRVGAGVLALGETEVVPVLLPPEPQAASKHTRKRLQTLNMSLEREK